MGVLFGTIIYRKTTKCYFRFKLKKQKRESCVIRRDLMGTVGSSFLLAFSSGGRTSHLKTRFQSKPPRSSVEAATYWKLSMPMTSITGQTIRVRSWHDDKWQQIRRIIYSQQKEVLWKDTSTTRCNNGSSQPSLHSQCESRKVRNSPLAISAPLTRDRTNPSRRELRIKTTFSICINSLPSLAVNLK